MSICNIMLPHHIENDFQGIKISNMSDVDEFLECEELKYSESIIDELYVSSICKNYNIKIKTLLADMEKLGFVEGIDILTKECRKYGRYHLSLNAYYRLLKWYGLERYESSGFVYLISYKHMDNIVKIGMTGNMRKRMGNYVTYAPFGFNIVGMMAVRDAKYIERRIHNILADRKLNGEWFDLRGLNLEKLVTDLQTQFESDLLF